MKLPKIKITMTRNSLFTAVLIAVLALGTTLPSAAADKGPKMTKQERVCLRNGNKLYEKKRYAEAEVEYRKALQANPASEKAQFNLATALMRQGSVTSQENDDKNPMKQAEGMLTNLAKGAQDKLLRGKACYDLGNIAYGRQDYGKAVEFYKHALRCNPDDEQARHNLRLAQLKKQQQDQNKDKNQDNKDQNKDQNQDKDQNKDKNKDQNKDQNKDNQDQNKDKQNQDKQNQDKQDKQDKQDQQQQQQQQGGMSQQNAEQVLKAMQDRERATQQRINAQQAQQQRHERQRTNKKW